MHTVANKKNFYLLIAIIISILITGFFRLQLIPATPETDGGINTFVNQFIYFNMSNGNKLDGVMPLHLYSHITAWVYNLDINQYIFLKVIDGLVAVFASILFFKIILKESGSIVLTVSLIIPLLIQMNHHEIIGYGFKNSIWISYVPLFTALLVWQNFSIKNNYYFYLIGALVALGVLFREPFLPIFIFTAAAILIGYGWRLLIQYLIGSGLLGLSIIIFILLIRGGDLVGFINSYIAFAGGLDDYSLSIWPSFFTWSTYSIKANWLLCFTSCISILYIVKLYFSSERLINTNRFYFWLGIALVPLIEPILKLGFPYHFYNCIPGLAGMTAMTWKYININELKLIKKLSISIITLMSVFATLPAINKIINNDAIFTPSSAITSLTPDFYRLKQNIENNNYLTAAAKIYSLSRADSSLVVSGHMQALYPLTGLLPPTYELNDLRTLYSSLNFNKDKLGKIIEKYRPTLIMTTNLKGKGEKDLPEIIEKTNLYRKVAIIKENMSISYGWKAGTIYRLKDFK